MLEGFSSAQDTKNRMAWIKLNSNDEVTKIVAATNDDDTAGDDDVYTSTRAIISSKTAKGLSYIANWPTTSSSTTDYKAYIIEDKVGQSDYAAYAADCAFYTINVHPANNDITNSVKKSIDGDYTVEVGSSSSVLASTINGKSTDIYYAADLYFNDDGDIMAVYMYTKNVDVASTTAPEIKDITYTSTNATSAADNFVSNSADVAVNDDLTFTVTYPTSGAVVKLNGTTVDPTEAGGNTYKVDTTTTGTFEYTITAENCNDLTLTANVGVKALTADAQVGGVSVAGDEVATGSSVTFSATDKNGATVSGITVKDSTGASVANPLTVSDLGEATYTVSADGYTDADVSFTVVKKTIGAKAMSNNADVNGKTVVVGDTVEITTNDSLNNSSTPVLTVTAGGTNTTDNVKFTAATVNDGTGVKTAAVGTVSLTLKADGYDDETVTFEVVKADYADTVKLDKDTASYGENVILTVANTGDKYSVNGAADVTITGSTATVTPLDVGTYEIVVKGDDTTNDKTLTLTITKATRDNTATATLATNNTVITLSDLYLDGVKVSNVIVDEDKTSWASRLVDDPTVSIGADSTGNKIALTLSSAALAGDSIVINVPGSTNYKACTVTIAISGTSTLSATVTVTDAE
jgi:hypothetical protein